MKITIETLPHAQQRYPTAGDWWIEENGDWQVRVSELGNWRLEFLVALHELVEIGGCLHAGISQDDVTAFDLNFDLERREGEPGDATDAPYREQHERATVVEATMAAWLDVDWKEYDTAIGELR